MNYKTLKQAEEQYETWLNGNRTDCYKWISNSAKKLHALLLVANRGGTDDLRRFFTGYSNYIDQHQT